MGFGSFRIKIYPLKKPAQVEAILKSRCQSSAEYCFALKILILRRAANCFWFKNLFDRWLGRAAESWAQWITKLRIKTRTRPSTDRIVSITVHDLNVSTTVSPK